jgi:hypothetical protein
MKRSQSFEKKQADKLFAIKQKYEMVFTSFFEVNLYYLFL